MEPDGKAQGALNPPSASEVAAMLDAEGKVTLEKLNTASGANFDSTYVAAQNREHLSATKLARGQIKEHIDHL
jgi:putative membrane protein